MWGRAWSDLDPKELGVLAGLAKHAEDFHQISRSQNLDFDHAHNYLVGGQGDRYKHFAGVLVVGPAQCESAPHFFSLADTDLCV